MILHPIIDRLKTIAELLPTAIGGEFVPSGTKQISITENGTTTENVFSYADAEITVNVPPSGIVPTGTKQISITENGTTTEDVTNYANAEITVNVPTGPSLPSIISKIDGGSFTPSNDILATSYPISHTLGTTPTGIAIWSENIVVEVYAVRTLDQLISINGDYVETQINTNGNKGNASGTLTDVDATSFTISISSMNYKAGTEYKWLVWA